jgi:hypothetical protein
MQGAVPVPYFGTGDPESEVYTTLPYPGMLGSICEFTRASNNICRYQLVKVAAGITTAVGNVMYWSDKSAFTVTTSRTNRGLVAGIARIVATAGQYIWIVKKGDRQVVHEGAPTVAAAATGLPVIPGATTDGAADTVALTTAPAPVCIGHCLSTVSGGLINVRINIYDWM